MNRQAELAHYLAIAEQRRLQRVAMEADKAEAVQERKDGRRKKREQKELKAKEWNATQNKRGLARLIENQKRKISNKTKKKKRATAKAKSTIGKRHSYANQCFAVRVGGILYASISSSAAAHNISQSAMSYRLNTKLFDAEYVDDDVAKRQHEKHERQQKRRRENYRKTSTRNKLKRPVIVDGVRYESRVAAAKAFDVHPTTIDWRIQSKYFDAHYE